MAGHKKRKKLLPKPAISGSAQVVVASKPSSMGTPRSWRTIWVLATVFSFVAGAAMIYSLHKSDFLNINDNNTVAKATMPPGFNPPLTIESTFTQPDGPKPATLKELLALPKADMAKVDILRMNLLCASGLPGSEDMDIDNIEKTLDQWAFYIANRTSLLYPKFLEDPAKFDYSEAYFRMLVLVWTLQTQFNVHYNPDFVTEPDKLPPESVFFANSKDVFLNGLINPRAMGTCGSLPALYVAVGRRLGYPMKFVITYDHGFARWESPDGKERFNIEATQRGMSRHPDDFYKTWPHPIGEEMIRNRHYLQSLTPLEELAVFLHTRVTCLKVANRLPESREAALQAQRLTPDWEQNRIFLAQLDRLMHPQMEYFPLQKHPEDSNVSMLEINRQNQQRMLAEAQQQADLMNRQIAARISSDIHKTTSNASATPVETTQPPFTTINGQPPSPVLQSYSPANYPSSYPYTPAYPEPSVYPSTPLDSTLPSPPDSRVINPQGTETFQPINEPPSPGSYPYNQTPPQP